ncbi:LCP family protein [Bengtsoniella intestinalis]|uniref:LCP family protein n=1 Tax=Bengtsoniella intestinalis TaxID=3073143 RepID=UPI00391F3394
MANRTTSSRSERSQPPRKRRRTRNNKRVAILLGAILLTIIAIIATVMSLFIKAPEISTDDNETAQTLNLSEEELVALAEQEAADLAKAEAEAAALAAHLERKDNFYTILVSGVDDDNGGSDTNILVGIDFNEGTIHGVSIPRDTKCYIDGTAYKINASYNIGGVALMADTISDMLGIPVDFTVEVSLDAFVALVDTIGAVYFNVPVDMNYDDPLQDLSIHFEAGYQWLTGEDALGVVRYRSDTDGTGGYGSQDIGRMATQQSFLIAIAQQALTVGNLDKLSSYVDIFETYVDTDLTTGNLIWLGTQTIGLGSSAISFSTLSGEWTSPYIYADASDALTTVNTYLNPYVEDRVAADLNVAQ